MINASGISSLIESIKNDVSLYNERCFNQRADAIDDLEFYLADGIDDMALKLLAGKLKAALEEVDNTLFNKLRAGISSGKYRGQAFKKMLEMYFATQDFIDHATSPEYDNLDIFINRLFPFDDIPAPVKSPEPEMVFYQKTPARIVLELVEQCDFKPEDIFVDIGSGLGQVTLLVNLLAGIKALGIEFEPAFCKYARDCTKSLRLEDVAFVNTDARQADYCAGTVFFMFTPFRGTMLDEVLERLRAESLSRRIRLVTYGPCTTEIASQNWLKVENIVAGSIYRPAFFSSY